MSDSKPYQVRWGILATGMIAKAFVKDLLLDPKSRQVDDVSHTVVAAASSSSASRAQDFLKECNCASDAKAYGSYAELVKDPNVDIIYVATPHSHHYQNTMLCLEAGKPVLCEKAFTTNAAQAKILVETTRKKGLFLMEAVWTRYFPLSRELRQIVKEGKIGKVHRVFADFSFGENVEEVWGTEHRMVNLDLAGGAMLDLGIYSLTWVFQFLYHIQDPSTRKPPSVASTMTKYKTGADETTSILLNFPSTGAHGIATTTMRVSYDPDGHETGGPAVRIQGTNGEIHVYGSAPRPRRYVIVPRVPGMPNPSLSEPTHEKPEAVVKEHKIRGHGMFWEADECARCLRDGKKESETLGLEESVVIMEVMDEVRRQNGLKYPERIESTEYPLEGF